jgi:hypothetical protein
MYQNMSKLAGREGPLLIWGRTSSVGSSEEVESNSSRLQKFYFDSIRVNERRETERMQKGNGRERYCSV